MNFRFKTWILSLVLMLSIFNGAWGEEGFSLPKGQKRAKIQIVRAGSLVILKTYLNGKGPFNFVLDSGSGLLLITDPSLKDSLNLEHIRKIDIAGLGETEDLIAYVTPAVNVRIGKVEAKRLGAVILAEQPVNLSEYAGVHIHGLIGYDFFNSFTVKTFLHDGYIVCTERSTKLSKRRDIHIPVSIERKRPYCLADVETKEGKKYRLKLLIDSGGEHTLALESWGNKNFPLPSTVIEGYLGLGLEGRIRGYFGRITKLKIHQLELTDLLTSFPVYEDVGEKVNRTVARNGSLGCQLLQYFNVIYDYRRGFIALDPVFKDMPSIEYDMSDLEIVAVGEHYNQYVINKVKSEQQGEDLQKGDILVTIDFKSVSKLRLDEIYQILRSGDGRSIYVTVKRNNRIHHAVVKLKKKI